MSDTATEVDDLKAIRENGSIGINSFGTDEAPCPGLVKMNGVYGCDVLVNTEYYDGNEEQVIEVLGVGYGCRNNKEKEMLHRKMWASHKRRMRDERNEEAV